MKTLAQHNRAQADAADTRARQVAKLRNAGMPVAEIARKMKVTPQRVYQLYARIMA